MAGFYHCIPNDGVSEIISLRNEQRSLLQDLSLYRKALDILTNQLGFMGHCVTCISSGICPGKHADCSKTIADHVIALAKAELTAKILKPLMQCECGVFYELDMPSGERVCKNCGDTIKWKSSDGGMEIKVYPKG